MLRSGCSRSLRAALRRPGDISYFSTTSVASSHQPNAPLDLDPSFEALLKDADMSILRHRSRHSAEYANVRNPRELEEFPSDPFSSEDVMGLAESSTQVEDYDHKESRKSPAALFGSQRIGAVVLPFELRKTITRLIAESDKAMLHADATRLFAQDSEDDPEWVSAYDIWYKSRRQAARHGVRDGTAFASIALPSHYSAIYAVLDHVKLRMGPEWKIERVIDWGSGTGTGLWAASHSFQKRSDLKIPVSTPADDLQISQSTVLNYLGIDKRDGLVSIGKRLVQDVDLGGLTVSWKKSFRDDDKIRRSEGGDVLALSAFLLSSLPTPLARKALVKEMWDSGAGIIVLIDHNSNAGFDCIAEAREYLLRLGKKDLEDPEAEGWDVRGSHVVAPCPHDGACPLYNSGSSKFVCGFSQRLQRPAFVRKTKHSGIGHEDTGYSYVVIRRGSRPMSVSTKMGRIGDVGRRELDKIALKQVPLTELVIDGDNQTEVLDPQASKATTSTKSDSSELSEQTEDTPDLGAVEAALRSEAYSWPRLVFPPLKRSGHVILDGCTAQGKIMRMTIPKSQGKQPYYDARKSGWGDIFPHEPKNAPQQRFQPSSARRQSSTKGGDIGERAKGGIPVAASYSKLSADIRDQKRKQRRIRVRVGDDWE
ncbi:hypothetical protein AcV7_001174 [Taiwanofungus camphoratus]|nr:hypothetical protein AcW2_000336 [Antrodia cinnamomea]KAI0962301.1 hypothetical protein AcV7_001174 [Antrodia cinnamomea]